MQKLAVCILLFTVYSISYSQVLSSGSSQVQAARNNPQVEGSPLANFFQKRTPMMDILHALVKDDDGIVRHYVGAEVGSAYENETFLPGKVFYNEEELGDVHYRFNAYNNEIELKKTSLDEEKPIALIKNEEVKIIDGTKEIVYRTFMDDRENIDQGYLTVLLKGEKYNLYKRLYKKFTEPRPAANSMVAPTPSRFTDYLSYYYQKTGEEKIIEIPLKTNKFLKKFSDGRSKDLKEHIKTNNYDLEKESNLIMVFRYMEGL